MHVAPFHSIAESFKAVIAGEAEGRHAFIVFITILVTAGLIWLIVLIFDPVHSTYYIDS